MDWKDSILKVVDRSPLVVGEKDAASPANDEQQTTNDCIFSVGNA